MNELALFAGAGGGILGGHLLGWRTVCAVEWEPYPASVLCARQNDGILPPFPIWDDVQTFDGKPWRGIVDVISGGFPCQDISAAGKGAGINGKRSGMWFHMARIIGEVRPRYVYVENSPLLTSRGLHRVLGDLAEMGFDARWGVVSAAAVGAPHKRDRIWIVAHANGIGDALRGHAKDHEEEVARRATDAGRSERDSGKGCSQSARQGSCLANTNGLRQLQQERIEQNQRRWAGDCRGEMADATSQRQQAESNSKQHSQAYGIGQTNQPRSGGEVLADANGTQCERGGVSSRVNEEHANACSSSWWLSEPDVGRVAHGVAARVDRLKAIGNGQVPFVAATAWRLLNDPA